VEDHSQAEVTSLRGRQKAVQIHLDLDRIVLLGHPKSSRKPADMSIDRQAGKTERDRTNDVGRLSADARE
jgi:hypothetical protein